MEAGLTDLLPSRQSRLDLSPTPSASSGVALALTDRDNKSHCGGQADPPRVPRRVPYPVFRRTLTDDEARELTYVDEDTFWSEF